MTITADIPTFNIYSNTVGILKMKTPAYNKKDVCLIKTEMDRAYPVEPTYIYYITDTVQVG